MAAWCAGRFDTSDIKAGNAGSATRDSYHLGVHGTTQRGALGLGHDENAFVAEIGMQMSVGRAGAISLDWQGLSGDNRSQHNLAATYRLSF